MVPKVLVSKTSRTVCIEVPSKTVSMPIPALLTRASIGPAAATALRILSASVTSSGSTRRCSERGSRSSRGERIEAMTFQSRSRKYWAVLRPNPDEQRLQRFTDRGFVINDQDGFHRDSFNR